MMIENDAKVCDLMRGTDWFMKYLNVKLLWISSNSGSFLWRNKNDSLCLARIDSESPLTAP